LGISKRINKEIHAIRLLLMVILRACGNKLLIFGLPYILILLYHSSYLISSLTIISEFLKIVLVYYLYDGSV
ncbi:MAG: hypothetical protein ACRCR9_03855, partial [Chitinophagaceae bacterium]